MTESKERWKTLKIVGIVLSVCGSLFIMYQNERINHRLDTRDAYFNKGLIDGAKDREKAYYDIRNWGERVMNHCRANDCNLPNDLSVIPNQKQFDSLEAILTRNKE